MFDNSLCVRAPHSLYEKAWLLFFAMGHTIPGISQRVHIFSIRRIFRLDETLCNIALCRFRFFIARIRISLFVLGGPDQMITFGKMRFAHPDLGRSKKTRIKCINMEIKLAFNSNLLHIYIYRHIFIFSIFWNSKISMLSVT